MATFTATRAASTFPIAKSTGAGVLHAAYGTINISAEPAPADIPQAVQYRLRS